MHPYLEHRFSTTFKAPSVQLLTKKNIHFVLINSMALEKDGCHICNQAEAQVKFIGSNNQLLLWYIGNKKKFTNKSFILMWKKGRFKCTNGTGRCYQGMQLKSYSRPILLQVRFFYPFMLIYLMFLNSHMYVFHT